ncbi:MAG: hypothetical protein BM560_05140 [Roseobacter sp. MedPE-SWde]|nr:MAG: hypothetical protein BM560_05140 [Roseobacter sp. MedPE-SWde]
MLVQTAQRAPLFQGVYMRNRRAEIEAKVKARTFEVWCESLQSYCWEWTGPSSGSGRGGD